MAKKILMVVPPNDFRDEEYVIPRRVLEEGGVEVKVASVKRGESRGVNGAVAHIDFLAKEALAEDFEGIVFVGGPGTAVLIDESEFKNLAQKFYSAGKLVAAICVAPAILAKAGLLKNKRATSWQGAAGELKIGGAEFTGDSVTVDGRLITADGPEAAEKFGKEVLKNL